MSYGEIVNFSSGAVERVPLYFYICTICVCESHNCWSKNTCFFFPQFLFLFSLLILFSLIPLFFFSSFAHVSLSAGTSFIHAPGPSMSLSAPCQVLLFKNSHSWQIKENKLNTWLPCWCSSLYQVCASRNHSEKVIYTLNRFTTQPPLVWFASQSFYVCDCALNCKHGFNY